jgi:hypothetical protein
MKEMENNLNEVTYVDYLWKNNGYPSTRMCLTRSSSYSEHSRKKSLTELAFT